MTSSITNLRDQIQSALAHVDVYYKGNITTVTTTSNVATDNKYRPLLDSIRSDLLHYDDEEKAPRIIYNIDKHLAMNSKDDPDLAEVLTRVLEIVKRYQKTHEIIMSPVKPQDSNSVRLVGTPRRLFDVVAPMLEPQSDNNGQQQQ